MASVLVAHNSEELCGAMARHLRDAGHDVIVAHTGPSAAELIATARFEVVVAQQALPRAAGSEILDTVVKVTPHAHIILLVPESQLERAATEPTHPNLYDRLADPVEDLRVLSSTVERAVLHQRLRRENATLVADLGKRVRELDDARRRIADLAERDPLTGLLNHVAIHARLRGAVQRSHEPAPAVMLADMDGFRSINETYGHAIGDDVLRYVAACLRETCATNAEIGRSGSDEFMAVFASGNAEVAAFAAERLRCYMANRPYVNPQGTPIPMRMCFGIADARTAGPNATSLVAAADAALNAGKQRGGGTVTLHMDETEAAEQAEWSTFGVLDGLVTAIDNKDKYTRRHSEHVAAYALMLGEAVGLPGDQLDALRTAGLLHDVGKIGMPDAVLLKPGRLTHDETEAMKAHVMLSYHILQGAPGFEEVRDAIAGHHERWDGNGYPNGLAGEDIPLLSRILAIADTYSAMTLDRRYRAGVPHTEAIAEIERGAGTQFDPFLARLFVDIAHARVDLPQVEMLRAA